MASESADLAQMLRTTLHLVERRMDIDQQAPSVHELKESMRRTIAEAEQGKTPTLPAKKPPPPIWARTLRRKKSR